MEGTDFLSFKSLPLDQLDEEDEVKQTDSVSRKVQIPLESETVAMLGVLVLSQSQKDSQSDLVLVRLHLTQYKSAHD